MDTMHGEWAGMGFGMWIFWILFVVAIVVLIRIVFGSRSDTTPPDLKDDALEILNKRYALGEIEQDEFERMKKQLENK